MDTGELVNKAKKVLGSRLLESGRLGREAALPLFWVSAQALAGAIESLRSETELGLDRLENLSAMHWDGAIVLSYFLRSSKDGHVVVVRATQEPKKATGWVKFPSVRASFPAAEAQELEISEGLGVRFVAKDQDLAATDPEGGRSTRFPGVEGFPLRKDFSFPREVLGIPHLRKGPE